jgi:hypothetical protein
MLPKAQSRPSVTATLPGREQHTYCTVTVAIFALQPTTFLRISEKRIVYLTFFIEAAVFEVYTTHLYRQRTQVKALYVNFFIQWS